MSDKGVEKTHVMSIDHEQGEIHAMSERATDKAMGDAISTLTRLVDVAGQALARGTFGFVNIPLTRGAIDSLIFARDELASLHQQEQVGQRLLGDDERLNALKSRQDQLDTLVTESLVNLRRQVTRLEDAEQHRLAREAGSAAHASNAGEWATYLREYAKAVSAALKAELDSILTSANDTTNSAGMPTSTGRPHPSVIVKLGKRGWHKGRRGKVVAISEMKRFDKQLRSAGDARRRRAKSKRG